MAGPNLLLYAVLGTLQGVVEWFPLSSSGQLSLILQWAGATPAEAVSAALWIHSGSLAAILLRFRGEFASMARSMPSVLSRRGSDAPLTRFMIVGTVFTGIIGIPVYMLLFGWFEDNPEGGAFTLVVGVLLVITGIALVLGSRVRPGIRGAKDLAWVDGAAAGAAQGFAFLPGISRSGFTLASLLARRIEKADALRLSFLLDAPAIMGAMVLTFDGSVAFSLPMAAAVVTAFLVSYVCMGAFVALARRIDLSRFCILYGSLAAGAAAVWLFV